DLVPAMIASKDLRPLTELALTPFDMPAANPLQTLQALYTAWAFPLTGLPRLTPLGWENRGQACTPLHHPPRGFSAGYYYTEGITPPSYDAKVVYAALSKAARDARVVD